MIGLKSGFFIFGAVVLTMVSINEQLRAEPGRLAATSTGTVRITLVVPPKSMQLAMPVVRRVRGATRSAAPAATISANGRAEFCFQMPGAGFKVRFTSARSGNGSTDRLYMTGQPGRVSYRPAYHRLPAAPNCRGQRGRVRLLLSNRARRQIAGAPHAGAVVMVVAPD